MLAALSPLCSMTPKALFLSYHNHPSVSRSKGQLLKFFKAISPNYDFQTSSSGAKPAAAQQNRLYHSPRCLSNPHPQGFPTAPSREVTSQALPPPCAPLLPITRPSRTQESAFYPIPSQMSNPGHQGLRRGYDAPLPNCLPGNKRFARSWHNDYLFCHRSLIRQV